MFLAISIFAIIPDWVSEQATQDFKISQFKYADYQEPSQMLLVFKAWNSQLMVIKWSNHEIIFNKDLFSVKMKPRNT